MKWDLRRTARYYFLRLKRLQGSPYSLAMGLALGSSIAITPTLPLHTVMIVSSTLLLRVNTIAALLIATVISNPLTFIPQYWLAWRIGDFFFPDRLSWIRLKAVLTTLMDQGIIDSLHTLSKLSMDAMLVLLTGGMILAIPLGFLTYFISYNFFYKLRQKRQQKHLLN